VTEKGQKAPALVGKASVIPAERSPTEATPQRIIPEIRAEPYAFLSLVFCEGVEEFLEGKIGQIGGGTEHQGKYKNGLYKPFLEDNRIKQPT
jgi:hypothetical protein